MSPPGLLPPSASQASPQDLQKPPFTTRWCASPRPPPKKQVRLFLFLFLSAHARGAQRCMRALNPPPPPLARRAAGPDGADTAESLQAFRPLNANPKPLTNPYRSPLNTNPKHRTNPHRFPLHTNPESSQTLLAADHQTAACCYTPARPSALSPAHLRGRRAACACVSLHLRQAIIPLHLQ